MEIAQQMNHFLERVMGDIFICATAALPQAFDGALKPPRFHPGFVKPVRGARERARAPAQAQVQPPSIEYS